MSSNWHKGPALVSVNVQKANGAIIEIADDVMHHDGGLVVRAAGRMTEQDRTEPGEANLTVNNETGKYTPGATGASVRLDQGMPVVARETVGRRTFPLFDGTLAQPQASFQRLDGGVGDRVAVTAIDWVGGQQQGRKFVGTLAEHIIYNGGSALTVYYPCGDSGTNLNHFESAVPNREPLPIISVTSSAGDLRDNSALFTFGTTDPLLGDDLRRPFSAPQMTTTTPNISIFGWYPQVVFDTPITVGSGEYLTLAWWVTPATTVIDAQYSLELAAVGTDNILDIRRLLNSESPAGAWRARVKDSGITWNITATAQSFNYGDTLLLSATISPSPGSLSFFAGARQATGTVTGSPPASYSFDTLTISDFTGSFNHLQIYKGSVTDWSYTKHLAQFRQGLDPMYGGLRWQRTDERLATLSRYAGLADSQLQLDRGIAYMPRASLAGKTWLQAAAEAVETEQGRLIWRDQHLEFHNRVNTRYNV